MLVGRSAEVIFLASCIIRKGNPIGMPCPNYEAMKTAIERKVENTPVVDWTH